MRTPSLRARLVAAGLAVVVVVLAGLDVFVYVNLRSNLLHNLDQVLATRARLVQAEAVRRSPEQLASFLGRLGLRGEVRGPDGVVHRADPLWPGLGDDLPPPGGGSEGRLVHTSVALPRGGVAVVSARRSGVDRALRRLAILEVAGTVTASVLAAVVLWRVADVVLAPLAQVVAAARRTAAGHSGERLRPDRPGTRLGEMAAAYDHMLDGLEAAVGEAEAAEARSRRFLADAAHQLRSPVAGAQACAETLLREAPGPAQDRLLADLARETTRAARLMSGLLQVARLDQGQAISPRPSDLVGLCTTEAVRVGRVAPGIDIVVRAGPGIASVDVDPDAVREIVSNLLDNARRHATARIEVTVTTGDGTVEVRVGDDGPGLGDDQVERAFERFVSLDAMGGSGLGLPIARGLARSHGGDLVWEDATFVLRLPARPSSPDSLAGAPRSPTAR